MGDSVPGKLTRAAPKGSSVPAHVGRAEQPTKMVHRRPAEASRRDRQERAEGGVLVRSLRVGLRPERAPTIGAAAEATACEACCLVPARRARMRSTTEVVREGGANMEDAEGVWGRSSKRRRRRGSRRRSVRRGRQRLLRELREHHRHGGRRRDRRRNARSSRTKAVHLRLRPHLHRARRGRERSRKSGLGNRSASPSSLATRFADTNLIRSGPTLRDRPRHWLGLG